MKTRRTQEENRFWQELRRSNAATPHKSKKAYSRKAKHKGRLSDPQGTI